MEQNVPIPVQRRDSQTLPPLPSMNPYGVAVMETEVPNMHQEENWERHQNDINQTQRAESVVTSLPTRQPGPPNVDWQGLSKTLLETLQQISPPRPTMINPQLTNAPVTDPQLVNPQLANPQLVNPQMMNPPLTNHTEASTTYFPSPLSTSYQKTSPISTRERWNGSVEVDGNGSWPKAYPNPYQMEDTARTSSQKRPMTVYSERPYGPTYVLT
jgi:hypothetical protein